MAERSFVNEVKKLRLGAGEEFRGEGILAVTKALLESGVSYVAGYQGAPISHLMDVLADAQDILAEQGIRFENSASEATAAATAPAVSSRLVVPEPPAGVAGVTSMRVTEFRDYLACPYRYWLRHRLRLAAVTDGALELGPADFGTLIHECLDRFAKREELTRCTDGDTLAAPLPRAGNTGARTPASKLLESSPSPSLPPPPPSSS